MEGVNAGNARIPALIGVKGEKGDKGDKGDNGRGVAEMTIDNNGHLITTYTDSETEDVGDVMQRSVTGVEITNTHDIQVDYSDETSEVIGNLNNDIDNIVANRISAFRDYIYPVGSIYETINPNFDPNVTFGGTWERVAEGMNLVGVGTGTDKNGITKTYEVGENTGEYKHTLSSDELPNHKHHSELGFDGSRYVLTNKRVKSGNDSFFVIALTSDPSENHLFLDLQASGGSDQAHDIVNPSFAIYIWKRTA